MNFKPYILAVKEILLSSCKNEESLRQTIRRQSGFEDLKFSLQVIP